MLRPSRWPGLSLPWWAVSPVVGGRARGGRPWLWWAVSPVVGDCARGGPPWGSPDPGGACAHTGLPRGEAALACSGKRTSTGLRVGLLSRQSPLLSCLPAGLPWAWALSQIFIFQACPAPPKAGAAGPPMAFRSSTCGTSWDLTLIYVSLGKTGFISHCFA